MQELTKNKVQNIHWYRKRNKETFKETLVDIYYKEYCLEDKQNKQNRK